MSLQMTSTMNCIYVESQLHLKQIQQYVLQQYHNTYEIIDEKTW